MVHLFQELIDRLENSDGVKNFGLCEKLWHARGLPPRLIEEKKDQYLTLLRNAVEDLAEKLIRNEEEQERRIKLLIKDAYNERKRLSKMLSIKLTEPRHDLKLIQLEKWTREDLAVLQAKKAEIMSSFLDLIATKEELEETLGLNETVFDKENLPSARTESKLKDLVEELMIEKETREKIVYNLTERITHLFDILSPDLNATSISDFVGLSDYSSIKTKDIKIVEASLKEMENLYKVKYEEVQKWLNNIRDTYNKLQVPEEDRVPLATGAVCGIEDLLLEENYRSIEIENKKMNDLKKINFGRLVEGARHTLHQLHTFTMRSNVEVECFFLDIKDKPMEEKLRLLEQKIEGLEQYAARNKKILDKVREIVSLSLLSDQVIERMKDKERLFKARGKEMVTEEDNRKKVNQLPSKCDRLLMLEIPDEVTVYGETVQDFINSVTTKLAERSQMRPGRLAKKNSKPFSTSSSRPPATRATRSNSQLLQSTHSSFSSAWRPTFNSTRLGGAIGGGPVDNDIRPEVSCIDFPEEAGFTIRHSTRSMVTILPTPSIRVRSPSPIGYTAVSAASQNRRGLRRSKSFSQIDRNTILTRSQPAVVKEQYSGRLLQQDTETPKARPIQRPTNNARRRSRTLQMHKGGMSRTSSSVSLTSTIASSRSTSHSRTKNSFLIR